MDEDSDCFVIPFNGDEVNQKLVPDIPPLKPTLDIPDGAELRHLAYRQIWDKIYEKSRHIIQRFHSSLTNDLFTFINEDESEVADKIDIGGLDLVGHELLRPALKTAVVLGGSKTILGNFGKSGGEGTYTTQLSATDCPNIGSAMRCLVSGFIGQVSEGDDQDGVISGRTKRSGITCLAPNDINLLEAWYVTSRARHRDSMSSKLVVTIPDVEGINPAVLEDLLYICSLHARTLPFVFMMGVFTSVDYLQRTLSHSAMTFLDITFFEAVAGERLCTDIVHGLFFDRNFESGIVLAPDTLDLIMEASESQLGSVDGLLNALQLLLLNHCSKSLSILLLEAGPEPSTIPELFRHHLLIKLTQDMDRYAEASNVEETGTWSSSLQDVASDDIERILKAVYEFRGLFFVHTRQFQDAFNLLQLLYGGSEGTGGVKLTSSIELFARVQDITELDKLMKKVINRLKNRPPADLQSFLQDVEHLFEARKEDEADIVEDAFLKEISAALAELNDEDGPNDTMDLSPNKHKRVDLSTLDGVMAMANASSGRSRYAEKIGNLLEEYLTQRLVPFHLLPLHDVWYIGPQAAKHVKEVLNPSSYSSITSALACPQAYLQCACCADARGSNIDDGSLTTLPDESIAFLRYLNSGKLVNVYDWFETFAMGLEGEEAMRSSSSPKKSSKVKKRREKTEEELEEWRQELQARFLRCFHEFDMLGLLKQTGRKQDHVMRAVYEMED